jgi:hypothetical protein
MVQDEWNIQHCVIIGDDEHDVAESGVGTLIATSEIAGVYVPAYIGFVE